MNITMLVTQLKNLIDVISQKKNMSQFIMCLKFSVLY